MKNYRLYIQFFSPDGLATSQLEVTVTAQNLFEAVKIKADDLVDGGYSLNEFLIYKVIPDAE